MSNPVNPDGRMEPVLTPEQWAEWRSGRAFLVPTYEGHALLHLADRIHSLLPPVSLK